MRIKELLRQKNMTAKELADKAGITPTGLSLAMSSRVNPSLKTLEKIAEVLDVPVSDLFIEPEAGFIKCPKCGEEINLNPTCRRHCPDGRQNPQTE